jgi:hypothetical protein
VLRFEKVTHAHPAECAASPAFTLTDEYVPQALAGLRLLGEHPAIVDDDLSLWKAALGTRPDVAIRVYPADNHLFFPGSGPSSPEEYEPAQHMDPEVIAGIASWLTT